MFGHLLFLDCETTGLNPDIHRPWEIAWKLYTVEDRTMHLVDRRCDMVSLSGVEWIQADRVALDVGRFDQRYYMQSNTPSDYLATVFASIDGKPRLVGSNPSFDDRFVGDWLGRQGASKPWHYHLIDLPSVALGELITADVEPEELALARVAGLKSDALSKLQGVDPAKFDRHTAMGDVDWCVAWWARLFNLDVRDV